MFALLMDPAVFGVSGVSAGPQRRENRVALVTCRFLARQKTLWGLRPRPRLRFRVQELVRRYWRRDGRDCVEPSGD